MGSGGLVRAFALAAVVVAGCGGTSTDVLVGQRGGPVDSGLVGICPAGTERCACYPNGTCNAELTCASSLCVRVPASGGKSSASSSAAPDAGPLPLANPVSGAGGQQGRSGAGGDRASAGGQTTTSGGRTAAAGSVGSGGIRATGYGGLGGSGGASDAGAVADGAAGATELCQSGQKYCGAPGAGYCSPPAPLIGCGLTGCDPCPDTAPANGYVTCANAQCTFDCLSGYTKVGDKCTGADASAAPNDTCHLSTCPACTVVYGPACCTPAGKCGCPTIPWVAPTCA